MWWWRSLALSGAWMLLAAFGAPGCTAEARVVPADGGGSGGTAGASTQDAATGGTAGTAGTGATGGATDAGTDATPLDSGHCSSVMSDVTECQLCLEQSCSPEIAACEADTASLCACGTWDGFTGQANCFLHCALGGPPTPPGLDICAQKCGGTSYTSMSQPLQDLIDCTRPLSMGAPPECPCFKKL